MQAVPLPREFYLRDTLDVARELLGKTLIHVIDGKTLSGTIIETEAYIGPEDKGAHSYKGRRTKRTEAMFGQGGHAYVYLIYGNHHCFNVVTQKDGMPEAVLIRAIEPIEGVEEMARRRGVSTDGKGIYNLTSGPGKLCQAMGITREQNKMDLCGDKLFITEGEGIDLDIVTTPRIGIDYAGEYRERPWRFVVKDSPYLSRKVR